MEFEQIEAMVGVLRGSSRLTEVEIRSGGTTLRLRRSPEAARKAAPGCRSSTASAVAAPSAAAAMTAAAPGAPTQPAPVLVTSHLVGVFRPHRKAPVSPGDHVEKNQVLGHIEAMRLMNDCVAPAEGRVQAVLVQEGQPVEYGQPLFEIVSEEA